MWQIEIHAERGGGGGVQYAIGYTGQSKITLELGLDSYLSSLIDLFINRNESPLLNINADFSLITQRICLTLGRFIDTE